MIEKLKTENLALHGGLVEKKKVYARALMEIVRIQRDKKKDANEKEDFCGFSLERRPSGKIGGSGSAQERRLDRDNEGM